MSSVEQQVQSLYIGYYGRAGDPDGLAYWIHQVENGMPLAAVAASFSVQVESKAKYAFLNGGSDASAFIDQIYANLFNRAPDAGGKAYWLDNLNKAKGNSEAISTFILSVIGGAQSNDLSVINNKIAAAVDFSTSVENAEIETSVHVGGMPVLSNDFVFAAKGVVDSEVTGNVFTLQDSHQETLDYINDHRDTKILIETVEKIVEKVVIQKEIVEVEKIVFQDKIVLVDKIVKEYVYVDVPVEVPGETIEVEPAHVLTLTLNAPLPLTSTKDYLGTTMAFGSGNTINNYTTILDESDGVLFGFKAHYRTGDDVLGVAASSVDVRWTMPAGAQSGLIGNESGANIDRSHASLDIILDYGVGKPSNGDFELWIDKDPTLNTNFTVYTLTNTSGGWVFLNPAGTAGQGMTSFNGGHGLADSTNLGFAFLGMPNGAAAGTGDVLPGIYDVSLKYIGVQDQVLASLDGQFFLQ